jgi:hypothetical protein
LQLVEKLLCARLDFGHSAAKEGHGREAGVVLKMTGMLHLTRQQQLVICVGLFLLLTGWAIKAWRTANAPVRAAIAADK